MVLCQAIRARSMKHYGGKEGGTISVVYYDQRTGTRQTKFLFSVRVGDKIV